MKKTKMKRLALLMMALVMVFALAACSGNKEDSKPVDNNQQQNDQQNDQQQTTDDWQVAADLTVSAGETEGVTLDIAEFQADPEDAVLADCNADVQAKMTAWLGELNEGDTLAVRAYVLDTEGFMSVVLTKEITPDYGSDADVYTYVYDKTTKNMMDLDYALAWKTVTDEVVVEALTAYLQADQKWINFTYDGFYVDTDGEPVYVLTTKVRQEGAEDWEYAYLLKDGQILGTVAEVMPEAGADGEAAA